ncbi:hypothetical protein N7495_002044, partial [Penicillium taxi]|uniref:uncharacterized protein n=1 Tax=Penicillium taxi TaxID=168475 RepID=UPI00254514EA
PQVSHVLKTTPISSTSCLVAALSHSSYPIPEGINMAALVQTISQQSGTVPVLQTRPSSSSTLTSSQTPVRFQQNMSWTPFNSGNSGTYRAGQQVVAPYSFAPNMNHAPNSQNRMSWSPHLRPEHRTLSAPVIPKGSPNPTYSGANPRVAHAAAGSVTTSSNSSSRSYSSPNRYRRTSHRNDSARSQSQSPVPAPTTAATVDDSAGSTFVPQPITRPRLVGHSRVSSMDDTSHSERPQLDIAQRYRRRSVGNMDSSAYANLQIEMPVSTPTPTQSSSYDFIAFDSNSSKPAPHSPDSQTSNHSPKSSASSVARGPSPDLAQSLSKAVKPDEKKTSKVSPLSAPPTAPMSEPKANPRPNTATSPPTADSPAARRLTELKNDTRRPGKSRLRRAFSFGSSSELLKASSQTKREAQAAEQARREALREELGEEHAAIAEQQEASGLGSSIYTNQGQIFTGSTDALSISSTASSASMMLRKMGKGMKKSTRSLVGLFRPKSVASVGSIDAPVESMTAPKVSVVNVEAEREIVPANSNPHDLTRGATVFPTVEVNGDIRRSMSIRERPLSEVSQSRKSILGGEKDRAEVLKSMKRGILKKSFSDVGVSTLVQAPSDSPHSSAPPTPDESSRPGPSVGEQVTIAGDDYFISDAARFSTAESKSAPITPQPVGRNIVFSPRIQFHETWPSGEYDRRGEIATCNRLTPLLAQQIREEINNFKMEMEVHENSKIYTHFI